MALHSQLTGTDLHEPKGVATAPLNTVYVADGSGSGSWVRTSAEDVLVADPEGFFSGATVEDVLSELYESTWLVSGVLSDISSISTLLLPIPFDCEVLQINMVLGGVLTDADATVTVTRSDGAAMGSQVVSFAGSTEGVTYEFVPTGNAGLTYSSHKYLKLVTDGASSGSVPLYCQAHLRRA